MGHQQPRQGQHDHEEGGELDRGENHAPRLRESGRQNKPARSRLGSAGVSDNAQNVPVGSQRRVRPPATVSPPGRSTPGRSLTPPPGAVVVPIYATSTYAQDGVGGTCGRVRVQPLGEPDPNRAGAMPGEPRGRDCGAGVRVRIGGRGLPAAGGVRSANRCRRPHVIIPNDAYGGTYRLFARVLGGLGGAVHAGSDGGSGRGARCRAPGVAPGCSGARRRPTRCSASPTSRGWRRSRTRSARCSSSTTRSPRRTCSSHWLSAPTWWCTARPSTSAATATSWAVRWSRPTRRWGSGCVSCRTRWAGWPAPSTRG